MSGENKTGSSAMNRVALKVHQEVCPDLDRT